jgi:hypothetical protein
MGVLQDGDESNKNADTDKTPSALLSQHTGSAPSTNKAADHSSIDMLPLTLIVVGKTDWISVDEMAAYESGIVGKGGLAMEDRPFCWETCGCLETQSVMDEGGRSTTDTPLSPLSPRTEPNDFGTILFSQVARNDSTDVEQTILVNPSLGCGPMPTPSRRARLTAMRRSFPPRAF